MKIVLIVLLAVVAMAASQRVQVVDRNPYEVQVVDHNPYEVKVVDRNPLEVQVVDRNPLEVQVVDRNPLEVQVVDNNPHVQVVDQPNPDAGNYNPDNFVVDEFFGQPAQPNNFQPIHNGPYIINQGRPKQFPPGARGGAKN